MLAKLVAQAEHKQAQKLEEEFWRAHRQQRAGAAGPAAAEQTEEKLRKHVEETRQKHGRMQRQHRARLAGNAEGAAASGARPGTGTRNGPQQPAFVMPSKAARRRCALLKDLLNHPCSMVLR
eukprot:SAG11_NODE_17242_length_524_cov_0.971765_1_plen_122_part_00